MTNKDCECNHNDDTNNEHCNGEGKHDGCGCECGHDHDHDHDHEAVVTFENEDGTTEDHPIIDEFEYNDNTYLLILNDDQSVTPLRVVGEEGNLDFLEEDEFNEVSKAYSTLEEDDLEISEE